MYRMLAIAALCFGLAACGPLNARNVTGLPAYAAVETVSLINTDKTLVDHVASWNTGKDCSTLRANEGGDYCVVAGKPKIQEQVVYCYRTLGATDCYTRKVVTNQEYLGTNEGQIQGSRRIDPRGHAMEPAPGPGAN